MSQKEVRNSIGHIGFYRHFIEGFSKITSPLFALSPKDVKFKLTNKY